MKPLSLKMKLLMVGLILANLFVVCHLLTRMAYLPTNFWRDSSAAFAQEESKPKTSADKPPEKAPSSTGAPVAEKTEKVEKADKVEEIKIELDSLEKKRIEIQEAERRLGDEKSKLEDLKQEIAQEVEALSKIHKELDDKLNQVAQKETVEDRQKREVEEKSLKQLVRVYSNMKPKDAGPIINRMDIEVAHKLFLRMKGDIAGRILSYVDKERAAQISERLAEDNKKINPTP